MKTCTSLLSLVFLTLLITGCSINPPLTLDQQRIEHLRTAEITTTPFILQTDYHCGPASLAMVMNYFGADVTPEQLAPTLYTPDAEGSFPAEMDATIRRQGFLSYPINSMEELLLELAAGHPVVVLQNLGIHWLPVWHYAVVIGFDLNSRELILRSGDQQRLETGMQLFNTTWLRSQKWARAILPSNQIPATATPLIYLKAASELDTTGPGGAAYQAYLAAVTRWPQLPLTHFALANYLLQHNQPGTAKTHFEQLLTLDSEFAPGWNNYAYSLDALGCWKQAIKAAQCASRLQPGSSTFSETLRELSTRNGKEPSGQCEASARCPH